MKNRDLLLILLLVSAIFFIGNYGKYFYQTFQITFNEWIVQSIYTKAIFNVIEEVPTINVLIKYKKTCWYCETDAHGRPSFFPTGFYIVTENGKVVSTGYLPIVSGHGISRREEIRKIVIKLPRDLEKGIHKFKVYLIQGSRGFWRTYCKAMHTDRIPGSELEEMKPYLKEGIELTKDDYCKGIDFKAFWSSYVDWNKLIQAMEEHKRIDSLAYAYDSVTLLICHGEPNAENCGIKEEKIVYRDCRDVGCPEGFECKEYNGAYVCIKEVKEIDYSLITIGIILFLIIALIVLKVKRII